MKILFYIAISLLMTACLSRRDKIPEGIMTQDQMVAFLIDLQLTEAKISTLRLPEDTVKKFYEKIEQELYRKHGIRDSVFMKSMNYYIYDIKGIEEIYSAVVDSLSLRERLQNMN